MNKPILVLDFETFWSSDYTLSKMPTIKYITDDRFEAQCVSVLCPVLGINEPTVFYGEDVAKLMANLKPIAHNLCLVGQNSVSFDALICKIHYGVEFGSHADTKLMGRFCLGSTQALFSLERLATRFGLSASPVYRQRVAAALGIGVHDLTDAKLGQALMAVKGKKLVDIPADALTALGEYCNSDVQLTAELHGIFKPEFTSAAWASMQSEASALLALPLVLDVARLQLVKDGYVGQRTLELEAFADAVGLGGDQAKPGKETDVATRMLKTIRSKPKFASLLRLMGVQEWELPTKEGKNGTIYAFSKTDLPLQELQATYEDGESLVPEAIRLRLEYQSSMVEKRTAKFIQAGSAFADNRWAMHIETFGAVNTARHSGGNATGGSPHNLSRAKPTFHTSCGVDIRWAEDVGIRDCIMAPPDKVMVVYDSSGVELRCVGFITRENSITDALLDKSRDLYCEFGNAVFGRKITKIDKALRNAAKASCLASDTEVLTDRGWVDIIDVRISDMIWDGESWVAHDGVIYQGEKDTIEVNGVRLTADHKVETENGWEDAGAAESVSLERWALRHLPYTEFDKPQSIHRIGEITKQKVYDILNAGPNHKFMVRSKTTHQCMIVHNCLSLQYLTGYRRLHLTFLLWRLPLDIDVAKAAHRVYRETKPNVVAFWNFIEKLLKFWCNVGDYPRSDDNLGHTLEGGWHITGCPAIKVIHSGFVMPNGFRLSYPELQFKPGRGMGTGYTYYNANKRGRQRLHPGSVLENLAQAVTTQVIDWQKEQIRLELLGSSYQFCGDVHDEVIATASRTDAERVKAVTQKWMSTSPPWWQQAVFDCEGGEGLCIIEGDDEPRQRYGAAK